MSADTDDKPDEKVLETLDFNPTCQAAVQIRWYMIPLTRRRRCTKSAVWMARFPCCGYTGFFCDDHRFGRDGNEKTGTYSCCGRDWHPHWLTWGRI